MLLQLNAYRNSVDVDLVYLVENSKFAVKQGLLWQNILAGEIGAFVCHALDKAVLARIKVDLLIKIPRKNPSLRLTFYPRKFVSGDLFKRTDKIRYSECENRSDLV